MPFIDCPLVGPAGTPYPATNTTVLYKLSLTGLNCTTDANVGDDDDLPLDLAPFPLGETAGFPPEFRNIILMCYLKSLIFQMLKQAHI